MSHELTLQCYEKYYKYQLKHGDITIVGLPVDYIGPSLIYQTLIPYGDAELTDKDSTQKIAKGKFTATQRMETWTFKELSG